MMHQAEQSVPLAPAALARSARAVRPRPAGPALTALVVGGYGLAPLGVVAVVAPPAIDFWWDWLMALGIVAAGGIGLLPLLTARWWSKTQPDAPSLRFVHELHRQLAYVLLGLVLVHAGGLLVLEPRVLDYLTLRAPLGMLAALIALGALVALVLSGLYRRRFAHPAWRRWHAGLSIAAVTLAAWHLADSGYYFAHAGQLVGLAWVLAVPTVVTMVFRRRAARRARAPRPPLSAGGGVPRGRRAALLLALGWALAAALFAWPGAESTDPNPYTCPVARCL